jgi:uncharacterized membrane protein YccF (DUF307 family)
MTDEVKAESRRERVRGAARKGERWAGYVWFMSLGTILPLIVFLLGYVVNVTLVGAPLARVMYRSGIWLATLGQEPPGQDKFEARKTAKEVKEAEAGEGSGKSSLKDRIWRFSPPAVLERRGQPVSMPLRAVWFVFVGWWLGAAWVVLAWTLFLLPYPMLDAVGGLLARVPSVMTLAWRATAPSSAVPQAEVRRQTLREFPEDPPPAVGEAPRLA